MASVILRFAEESPDVEVEISPQALPWLNVKPSPEHSAILLTAYMAGTIRSQLERGVTKNDSLAGAEQVIETYQQLKKIEPGLRIAEVKTLIDVKHRGKLKEYLEAK